MTSARRPSSPLALGAVALSLAVLCACGGPPGTAPAPVPAPPVPAPSSSSAPTPPPGPALPGQVIVPADGRVVPADNGTFAAGGVIGDGRVFAVMSYRGGGGAASIPMTLTTYDVTGQLLARVVDPPWIDEQQGFAITRDADGRDVLLAVARTTTPAQGVVPEQSTTAMNAVDARTLRPLWSTPVPVPDDLATARADVPTTTFPSRSGRFVLSTYAQPPQLLDLGTGAAVRPQPDAVGMVGDLVLVKPGYRRTGAESVRFVDVATGAVRGQTAADPDTAADAAGGVGTFPGDALGATASLDGSMVFLIAGYDVLALGRDGRERWRTTLEFTGTSYLFVDPLSGTVVVSRENGSMLDTRGLDPRSGRVLWIQPTSEVCGVLDGRVAALANKQLATLDARTGRQLAFDPATSTCPQMIAGGYSYTPERGIARYW